ncbi:30S ribosome-binding factor RbfA [Teredinibacter purpureus]|jgi:ribosome-binding factor A|uniref:30S ribosome-binding factor RbfA n=1 Tax=Teredinibacter purpureus TaxID=2731756 RepID=UPI0005F7C65C|nr:30S ribosome-binding factor RbfA [Teredinibacter purpureus]
MPREFKRSDRVADALQRSLANFIRTEIRDPRVGMVNVNSVSVNRDMANAKVYVTVVGAETDEEAEASVAILNKASGYLRNLIAKDLMLRMTPKLQFFYDFTAVHGQQLSSLIDQAVAEDNAHHSDDSGKEE